MGGREVGTLRNALMAIRTDAINVSVRGARRARGRCTNGRAA